MQQHAIARHACGSALKHAMRLRSTDGNTAALGAQVNKVVLAYSGGLDTSVILKWLQETYDCEVVTFTADLGQARSALMPQPRSPAACCLQNGSSAARPTHMQWQGATG